MERAADEDDRKGKGSEMSKDEGVGTVPWQNPHAPLSEETGGLDQPDRCQEGPFINRQGV